MGKMSEEVTRSQYLYRGRVINLRLDDVRLDNRHMTVREIVEHRGAVAVIALDDEGNVLLVRQYRSAAAREMLEIPAGTLEPGEDPALCAIRELKEETGYHAGKWQLLGNLYSSPGFSTEKMYLYIAHQLTLAEASPEEDESITVEKIPFAEALQKIESGDIVDAKSIVGVLRVARLLGK